MRNHSWNVSYQKASEIQKSLAAMVHSRIIDPSSIHSVAGIDVSSARGSSSIHAAIVVLDINTFETVETATASLETHFPYVPGFLSFREGPAVELAYEKLACSPDLLIFDGQGIAHPRRLGLAAHMGVRLNLPSFGCAKSRLIGDYSHVPESKGSYVDLVDHEEKIGAVLRTRSSVKPVFLSVGHLCDLDSTIRLTLAMCPKYRLPEPIRRAHALSNSVRQEFQRKESLTD